MLRVCCVMGDGHLTRGPPVQDADYEASGAKLVETSAAFQSDIVLKVRPPSIADEVPLLREGGHLVSYIQPALNKELVDALQKKHMTAIGAVPSPACSHISGSSDSHSCPSLSSPQRTDATNSLVCLYGCELEGTAAVQAWTASHGHCRGLRHLTRSRAWPTSLGTAQWWRLHSTSPASSPARSLLLVRFPPLR